MRNPVRDDARRMTTFLQRSNITISKIPQSCKSRSLRFGALTLHYSTNAILFHRRKLGTFIYTILSSCYHLRETSFPKNFENNNHNLIKKYKQFHFCHVQFTINLQYILQYIDIEINFLNSRSLYAIYVRNCVQAFTWACEWENLIVADAKLSKRAFVGPRIKEFISGRC